MYLCQQGSWKKLKNSSIPVNKWDWHWEIATKVKHCRNGHLEGNCEPAFEYELIILKHSFAKIVAFSWFWLLLMETERTNQAVVKRSCGSVWLFIASTWNKASMKRCSRYHRFALLNYFRPAGPLYHRSQGWNWRNNAMLGPLISRFKRLSSMLAPHCIQRIAKLFPVIARCSALINSCL